MFVGLVALGVAAAAAYAYIERNHAKAATAGQGHPETVADDDKAEAAAPGMRVEVVHPRSGGLERKLSQVCAVHAFEHAQLYAKISGFLKEQSVDIGDRVKRDQLLAVIDVPEILKAVDQAAALLDQSNAMVKVAEAKIRSAESMKKASIAMLGQRKAEVAAKTAFREYRYKQEERIRGLVEKNAVERKLLDEAIDQYEASVGDEKAAQAAILTAEADVSAKQAQIEQAQADLIDARANVEVSKANLEKAQVMASYTKITSPYDGVVTLRSFHRGDFIRSASEGGSIPLLAVARTDLMRVVIPVPDTQTPFVTKGDKATITVYGLEGRKFEGDVSRFSESEDAQDRAMRTEVDLPNNDGKLREGMYGLATILLEPASAKAVTVPSSSLLKQSGTGAGEVYVVRDGKAHKTAVQIGKDNGNEAEVDTGLSTADVVIARYNGALADGTVVTAEPAKLVQAPK
jgi:RND family efflux transporter MFP subunit